MKGGRGGKRMEGEGKGNGGAYLRGGRGEREREGPPDYYGFPPDLGVLE